MNRLVQLSLLFLAIGVAARINEPDTLIFGQIFRSVDNQPGAQVQASDSAFFLAATRNGGPIIDRYRMGDDPDFGDNYALKIFAEDISPLSNGDAVVPGDVITISVFEGSDAAAFGAPFYQGTATIGERGEPIELNFGSSTDTDNDGMPDADEVTHFGDLAQGPNADFDGDGLSNAEEIANGTDPAESVTFASAFDVTQSVVEFGDVHFATTATRTVLVRRLLADQHFLALPTFDNAAFGVSIEEVGSNIFLHFTFTPSTTGEASSFPTFTTTAGTRVFGLTGNGTNTVNVLSVTDASLPPLGIGDSIDLSVRLVGGDLSALSFAINVPPGLAIDSFAPDQSRLLVAPIESAEPGKLLLSFVDFTGNIAVNSGSGFIGTLTLHATADVAAAVFPISFSDVSASTTNIPNQSISARTGEVVVGICDTCTHSLDLDNDGAANFRDLVFLFRELMGHTPIVPAGTVLPQGEDNTSVDNRITDLKIFACDGNSPGDVDLDGSVDVRDVVFIARRLFGHRAVDPAFTLPLGTTEAEVLDRIDCLLDPTP